MNNEEMDLKLCKRRLELKDNYIKELQNKIHQLNQDYENLKNENLVTINLCYDLAKENEELKSKVSI